MSTSPKATVGMDVLDWRMVDRQIRRIHRQVQQAEKKLVAFRTKMRLWMQQRGVCPYCLKAIQPVAGWSVHHIFPKSQGGTDDLVNLQLLHPECHRRLHQEINNSQAAT